MTIGRKRLNDHFVFGRTDISVSAELPSFRRAYGVGRERRSRPARTIYPIMLGLFLSVVACCRTMGRNVAPTARSGPTDGGPEGSVVDAQAHATPAAEASICVDIDRSSYDTSCRADSDCILINSGRICAGYGCLCGNATINVSGRVKYEAVFDSIPRGTGPLCQCPALNRPHCIQGTCILCPYPGTSASPSGCPDAG